MSTRSIRIVVFASVLLILSTGFHLGLQHFGNEVRSRSADTATVGLAIASIHETHAGVELLQNDTDTLKTGQRNIYAEVAWLRQEMMKQRDSLMLEINRLREELDSVLANCK